MKIELYYVIREYKPDLAEMKHGPFGTWDEAYDAKMAHRWTSDKLDIVKQVIEVEVC